jgi:hypothetical protein
MVGKAVRLSVLHGVWRRLLVLPRESPQQPKKYVSPAVHIQLGVIISKGILDLEIDLLSSLQKLIFNWKGPGRENMIPIWIFLWLLILTYRETIDGLGNREQEEGQLPQLARHMYDVLVSTCSALFRPSSPLPLNWLIDDIYELFGRDNNSMQTMGTLKTEFFLFGTCKYRSSQVITSDAKGNTDKNRGHRHAKDVLLRSLIFEQEMKALKPPRDPLAQQYYESSKIFYPLWVNDGGHSNDVSVA